MISSLPSKNEFRAVVIVLIIGAAMLFGCEREELNYQFSRGDIIQTKIGNQVGQIIDLWDYETRYTIRFQRKNSKNGRLFETYELSEFELEKFNGERR